MKYIDTWRFIKCIMLFHINRKLNETESLMLSYLKSPPPPSIILFLAVCHKIMQFDNLALILTKFNIPCYFIITNICLMNVHFKIVVIVIFCFLLLTFIVRLLYNYTNYVILFKLKS